MLNRKLRETPAWRLPTKNFTPSSVTWEGVSTDIGGG